jgi:hypothetical protein
VAAQLMTTGRRSWCGLRVLMLSPTPTHPQDFGNRKRIFSVCEALKSRGATVSFIHYPAEDAWRNALPAAVERAMADTWDAYYTAPVSRDLHAAPAGSHHLIDEWWDEAIGALVRWLFLVGSYDVFIVNYAWLSKAFEYAPPQIFKILDTHDRVAGRREMLQQNGVAPEFFYTTEEQEAIALARADLVWAIKDEERAVFEGMTASPVLTLAHLDASDILPEPAADPEGYLRVGIVGARNNVNVTNIEGFLRAAIPVFDAAFAPVKIRIAGSVCQDLKQVDERFVELVGRLDSMRGFYENIDLACVPMDFSTGLKIKTAEALSYGVPVASLAHAFEGFAPQHRCHRLRDHASLARAIADIAFDRTQLHRLRLASLQSGVIVRQQIAKTLDDTWQLIQDKGSCITICTGSASLRRGSALRIALESAIQYLRYVGQVKVLVVSGSVAEIVASGGALAEKASLFASAALAATAAECDALAAIGVPVVPLTQAIESLFGGIVILDAYSPALEGVGNSPATLLVRTGFINLHATGAIDSSRLVAVAAQFGRVFVAGSRYGSELAAVAAIAGAGVVLMPSFFKSERLRDAALGLATSSGHHRREAVILWDPGFPHIKAVCGMLAAQGCEPVIVADRPIGPPRSIGPPRLIGNGLDPDVVSPRDFLDGLEPGRGGMLPDLTVDLSFGAPALQVVAELLARLRVPVVEVAEGVAHHSIVDVADRRRVNTYLELAWQIGESLAGPDRPGDAARRTAIDAEREGDGGWAWLWGYAQDAQGDRLLGISA